MKEINVLVTGAAGQIGYALLPRLVSGETFGNDVVVNLRLVEIPQVIEKLTGTIMELPSGPLGLAFGIEHRKEEGKYDPDAFIAAGLSLFSISFVNS